MLINHRPSHLAQGSVFPFHNTILGSHLTQGSIFPFHNTISLLPNEP
jgi:hypothetical protein